MSRQCLGVSPQRFRSIIITHICPCISSRCLWDAALLLLRSGGRRSRVGLSFREQRPGGARRLVGNGHGHEPRWLAFKQGSDPGPGPGIGGWRAPCHRSGTDDQQSAQIAIAHLRDPSQSILSARRVLSGHEPEPGRELPARVENGRIRHAGCERRGGNEAHARDSFEPLARSALPMPRHELAFDFADLFRQVIELGGKRQKRRPSENWQVQSVIGITQAPDEIYNLPWSLRGDRAELRQMCSDPFVPWERRGPAA